MNEPRVPERLGLELSFVRARWLAALALAILTPLGGFHIAATLGLVAGAIAANAAIWRAATNVGTLNGQRRLGVVAVAVDAAIVFSAGLAAPADAVTATLGTLVIVVAEVSVRFAPIKASATTAALLALLAATMLLRNTTVDDTFDITRFLVIALIALLVGMMVGSAVREVYRHRVTMPEPSPEIPDIPQEAIELLTARERQVLSLIVRGYSNAGIAAALVIEPKTVKNHINRIYSKLEINNRYEAITSVLGQRR